MWYHLASSAPYASFSHQGLRVSFSAFWRSWTLPWQAGPDNVFFYYGLEWSLDSCVLPRLTLQAVLSMLLSSTDWISLLISSFSRFYGFWTSWNLAVHGDTVHPEVANFYNSWTACLWAHFSQANLLAYKFLFQIHTHQPFSCLYILERWGLSVSPGSTELSRMNNQHFLPSTESTEQVYFHFSLPFLQKSLDSHLCRHLTTDDSNTARVFSNVLALSV